MKKTRLGLAVLGLSGIGLFTGCGGASPDATTAAQGPARVLAAPVGGALTLPSRADAVQIVSSFVKARGLGPASELVVTSAGRPDASNLRHLRLEQRIGGRRVYGAYVKATLDDAGRIVHLIENVVKDGEITPANAAPSGALAIALANAGLPTDLPAVEAEQGNETKFARTALLYRQPTVERVVYADDQGALHEGFLVETWTLEENLLDHTLVGSDGQIVSVERRTNNDRYNIFAEDPLKGAQTIVAGPASGGTESPSGWLGTGAQTTINITGNNAHAYLDADANNAPDTGGTAVTNGDFLTAVDLATAPSTTNNKAVAVQNLFYHNNLIHDILYRNGFVESEGNFQTNNFGRGGLGNDAVNAEAQDGSGTDNANFSTPTDGSAPRMQMYLWTGAAPDSYVTVSGTNYGAYQSAFGAALTTTGVTGTLAVYNDGSGVASDGCEASLTSLTGRIAIVDRGTCNFTVKVLNAQNAGATGVIIVNNTGTNEASAPGGTDRKVRISSVMVGLADGTTLKGRAGTSATLRKSGVTALQIDGDLDTDVVYHEYGHGLTWRMIGGMSGALAGAIGEGASDVLAFLVNGDDRIGEYAYSNPAGIRRQPYADYVGTYANANSGEVHNDGEIYAATMYDLLQLYQANGLTADQLLNDFVGGMRYTPATPAFEHMRDGMLQQVAGTSRVCLVWQAFAGRGIGVGASGTVNRRGAVTIVESYTRPSTCP